MFRIQTVVAWLFVAARRGPSMVWDGICLHWHQLRYLFLLHPQDLGMPHVQYQMRTPRLPLSNTFPDRPRRLAAGALRNPPRSLVPLAGRGVTRFWGRWHYLKGLPLYCGYCGAHLCSFNQPQLAATNSLTPRLNWWCPAQSPSRWTTFALPGSSIQQHPVTAIHRPRFPLRACAKSPCTLYSCMMAEAKAAEVWRPPDSATTTPAQSTKTWTWYSPKPISLILSSVMVGKTRTHGNHNGLLTLHDMSNFVAILQVLPEDKTFVSFLPCWHSFWPTVLSHPTDTEGMSERLGLENDRPTSQTKCPRHLARPNKPLRVEIQTKGFPDFFVASWKESVILFVQPTAVYMPQCSFGTRWCAPLHHHGGFDFCSHVLNQTTRSIHLKNKIYQKRWFKILLHKSDTVEDVFLSVGW